jgi:hypothetical protein
MCRTGPITTPTLSIAATISSPVTIAALTVGIRAVEKIDTDLARVAARA